MKKWLICFLLILFLFPSAVSAAPSFDPVPDGYDGYLPDSPIDENNDQAEQEYDHSDTLFDRIVASFFNGIATGIEKLIGGTNFDALIFNQANPISGQPYQGNTVGGIFSTAEWNNVVNPLRISLSAVIWMFFAVTIAYYGLKVMKDSTNPLKQIDLRDKLMSYIAAAIMLAFMHMIFFLLANLNNAFVQGLYGLIKDNQLFKSTFSLFDALNTPSNENPLTGSAVVDSILNVALRGLLVWFIILYIFRKFLIGILILVAPFAAWAFARSKDSMAFKMWLAELTSKIFIQTAHALVIVLYIGFLSNSLGTDQLRTTISGVLDPVLQFLIGIAAVVASGALMWNFLRLAFSGTNPKARYMAIQGVKYSLIGFFISAGALIVLNMIRGLIF